MYHSLTFYTTNPHGQNLNSLSREMRNTWSSYHLIPSSKPVIAPPGVSSIKYVEIPGRSDPIDLSSHISPTPIYTTRTGSVTFYFDREYWQHGSAWIYPLDDWTDTYTKLLMEIHGQKKFMILEDDPHYFYEGYFLISDWTPGESYDTVSFNYQLKPFKVHLTLGEETL